MDGLTWQMEGETHVVTTTEAFYTVAKKFQDQRADMVSKYTQKLNSMEPYRGSVGYDREVSALTKKHEEALEALRGECRKDLLVILAGMETAIGKRKINPPTNEQLNLIHVLKMREKVSAEELDRVAEMVKDNGICMGVIQEIAYDNGIPKTYACDEMSSKKALEVVQGVRKGLEDWLMHDTSKAGRMAAEYNSMHHGTPVGDLPKRPLFNNMSECFSMLAGLDADKMKLFSEIVNESQEGAET